jgi:tetratricopeptide (TPR) repeat protein
MINWKDRQMGIFDRLRSTAPAVANSGENRTDTTEQDATRLIDQGHVLEASGKLDEALQCYLDAIRLAPNPARAHLNHGNILLLKDDLDGALDAFRAAIKHKPGYAGAYYNMGNALLNAGKLDDAVANYRQALEIQPDYAEVHCVLGVALKELGQFSDAVASLQRALEINSDLAEAHLNLGSLFLSLGQYAEAWPRYEARYHSNINGKYVIQPDVPFPRWRSESLAGKSLVIWPEQGFGDEIQFSRYIPMLKILGVSRITLVCKSPLKALLGTLEGVDAVVSQSEAASLPFHDYWTFSMSLPLHFATTVETIPARLPYLSVLPERLDLWQDRLPTTGLKVGLVWKGSAEHKNDANRSLPGLSTLAILWSVPGLTFVSLQKGQGEEEAATPPTGQPILHMGSGIQDFADTAAIVATLDLVICIDTAIAHLTGALGKPCWVLLPASGTDWRWLRERTDTPWYPGVMRLFRQAQAGDWAATIGKVAQALETWVNEHRHAI